MVDKTLRQNIWEDENKTEILKKLYQHNIKEHTYTNFDAVPNQTLLTVTSIDTFLKRARGILVARDIVKHHLPTLLARGTHHTCIKYFGLTNLVIICVLSNDWLNF